MPSPFLFVLLGFILGLLFGSWLNVCIVRIPRGESIVKPRSHCMSCGHTVRWYDNLPILGWLILRGRCRDCKAPIPWRYPAVELAVGLWFAAAAYKARLWLWLYSVSDFSVDKTPLPLSHHDIVVSSFSGAIPDTIGFAILGFILIGLIVMDWQTLRLPDAFTLTGTAIGFALVCVQAFFLAPGEGDIVLNTTHQLRLSSPGSFTAQGNVFLTGTEALIMSRVAAIVGAALLLLIIRWAYKALRKQDGMGLGDVKLLAMIAAFLGFNSSLVAFFVGAVAASIYGVGLIVLGKARGATRLPFGSFLAAGGLFAALFGRRIVEWYASMLR